MVSLSRLLPSLQTLGFLPVFWLSLAGIVVLRTMLAVFVAPAFFGVDVHPRSNLARYRLG